MPLLHMLFVVYNRRKKLKLQNQQIVVGMHRPNMPSPVFLESLETSAISSPEIIKIRKKSNEVTPTDLPNLVDFAFIDGDHSFKSVQNDVQLLEPLMAKNSVLAFHDVLYFQGVSQIIGDVLKRGKWRLEGQVNNLVWLRKHKFEK